jgi:stalled ribosome alternative rescue factor ArfA
MQTKVRKTLLMVWIRNNLCSKIKKLLSAKLLFERIERKTTGKKPRRNKTTLGAMFENAQKRNI